MVLLESPVSCLAPILAAILRALITCSRSKQHLVDGPSAKAQVTNQAHILHGTIESSLASIANRPHVAEGVQDAADQEHAAQTGGHLGIGEASHHHGHEEVGVALEIVGVGALGAVELVFFNGLAGVGFRDVGGRVLDSGGLAVFAHADAVP